MIIQNGQNRNLAICNGRQVAMLRGGQWIINPLLSSAVKSQIYEDIVTTGHHSASLASEVWRAANLYCKSHAASHPELTSQGKLLSAFVNADKDMYCSLPLALTPEAQSALPKRYAIGGNGNYADSGIIGTRDTHLIFNGKITESPNEMSVPFGADASYNTRNFSAWLRYTTESIGYGHQQIYGGNMPAQTPVGVNFEIDADKNKWKNTNKETDTTIWDKTFNYPSSDYTTPHSMAIFAFFRNSGAYRPSGKSGIGCRFCSINDKYFIPSKISNLMELIDLETLTLATRVGTFTEQKDIPIS